MALPLAARLFEENTTLHHQLLLPARHLVKDFLASAPTAAGERNSASLPLAALALLGVKLPAFRGAQALLGAVGLDDDTVASLLSNVAPDGDGYGIAIGGWLDSARYARAMRTLLLRAGVTESTLTRRLRQQVRRRHLAEAALLASSTPSRRAALEQCLTRAREAAELTECHGPLMHARYLHHLRRLVQAHGVHLGTVLPTPSDIVHVTMSEIVSNNIPARSVVLRRRAAFESACAAPAPPVCLSYTADKLRSTVGPCRRSSCPIAELGAGWQARLVVPVVDSSPFDARASWGASCRVRDVGQHAGRHERPRFARETPVIGPLCDSAHVRRDSAYSGGAFGSRRSSRS